jgi:NADP-dependent 3-hydroxy acid dehydrogenase YdfG
MTVIKGYIALITGASSGMGYEMAKALLEKGATGQKCNTMTASWDN